MMQPTIEIILTDEVGKRETVKINMEQRFSHAPAPKSEPTKILEE